MGYRTPVGQSIFVFEFSNIRINYRKSSFNSKPYSRLGNNVRDFLQFEINGL